MSEPSGNGGNGKRGKPAKQAPNRLRGIDTRFKPGQSGNPKGRPKGTGLMEGIRRKLAANGGKDRRELEAVVIALAKQGDQRILAMLLDRLDGPVRQELAHTIERQVKLIEGVPEDAL